MEYINSKRSTVSIPCDLDFRFKKLASQKFRFEKGWYSKAMAEAMEMWLRYNDYILFNEGTEYVGRFLGMRMWERLKHNLNHNFDFKEAEDPLDNILDFFNKSSQIDKIKYRMDDKNLKIHLESPDVKKEGNFTMEDLLTQYLQPITIISRAGMEDITGDTYKIKKFEVGASNKIHLKKVRAY